MNGKLSLGGALIGRKIALILKFILANISLENLVSVLFCFVSGNVKIVLFERINHEGVYICYMRFYLCKHLLSANFERFSINKIIWKMRGMRDYAGSVMRNLSSVIIARGDRRTSRPTCFERGSLANDRENFLVYEICVEEGLFGGGLVCSWPI